VRTPGCRGSIAAGSFPQCLAHFWQTPRVCARFGEHGLRGPSKQVLTIWKASAAPHFVLGGTVADIGCSFKLAGLSLDQSTISASSLPRFVLLVLLRIFSGSRLLREAPANTPTTEPCEFSEPLLSDHVHVPSPFAVRPARRPPNVFDPTSWTGPRISWARSQRSSSDLPWMSPNPINL
jgi:hypothetical protein